VRGCLALPRRFRPLQKVSADPYFYSTSFPPTNLTFPRHALGHRAECVRLALDTRGPSLIASLVSAESVGKTPIFYSTSFPRVERVLVLLGAWLVRVRPPESGPWLR